MLAAFQRICSSPSCLLIIDNYRSIGIPDICKGAFGTNVVTWPRSGGLWSAAPMWRSPFLVYMRQFLERISVWNPAEFIKTPGWTPSTTPDSMLQRDIEGCAIDARLAARDYLHMAQLALVASWNDVSPFDHQNDGSVGRACAMPHTSGHHETLSRVESDNAIFKIDQKIPVENEKELIDVVVLVPMVFALHHRHPHDRVVHLAERLVVPLIFAGVRQFLQIDQLKWSMQNIEVGLIRKILNRFIDIHCCNFDVTPAVGKGISFAVAVRALLSFRAKKKPALSAANVRNLWIIPSVRAHREISPAFAQGYGLAGDFARDDNHYSSPSK